jgi:hypothetical protein
MEYNKKVQGVVSAWIVATIYVLIMIQFGDSFGLTRGNIAVITAILLILLIILTVLMFTTDIF